MALVNDAKKEIHAKIVYYGPAKAGKTTNLEFIYNKLKPEYRGKFKFLNTPSGRMVFFDFMRPELAGVKDFSLHFHIYTVPGDVVDNAIWRNVLKGVDGIVFVADMDPSRMLENRRSLEDLKEFLAVHSTKLEDIPCIFQLNKKDLSGAMTPEDMKNLLDTGDVLSIPAAARSAEGVLPTLSEMVKMILQKLRDTPLGEDDQPSVTVEEPESAEETAQEQVETPEPVALYTASEEIAAKEPAAEDEPLLLNEGLVEQDILPAEEPAVSSWSTETTEGFSVPSAGEDLTLDMEDEELAGPGVEGFGEPEPESWATALSPLADDAESATEESQPEIVLDGTLESLGDGQYRLPIVIRYAGKEKRTSLTLSLGFE
ncbi:MAG: ADP-ribosylation factor-like protein [Geobacteraceae bacterium]|nr:ADP-ribosylation factor-like protein [Geobacteraceae bacterium]